MKQFSTCIAAVGILSALLIAPVAAITVDPVPTDTSDSGTILQIEEYGDAGYTGWLEFKVTVVDDVTGAPVVGAILKLVSEGGQVAGIGPAITGSNGSYATDSNGVLVFRIYPSPEKYTLTIDANGEYQAYKSDLFEVTGNSRTTVRLLKPPPTPIDPPKPTKPPVPIVSPSPEVSPVPTKPPVPTGSPTPTVSPVPTVTPGPTASPTPPFVDIDIGGNQGGGTVNPTTPPDPAKPTDPATPDTSPEVPPAVTPGVDETPCHVHWLISVCILITLALTAWRLLLVRKQLRELADDRQREGASTAHE